MHADRIIDRDRARIVRIARLATEDQAIAFTQLMFNLWTAMEAITGHCYRENQSSRFFANGRTRRAGMSGSGARSSGRALTAELQETSSRPASDE